MNLYFLACSPSHPSLPSRSGTPSLTLRLTTSPSLVFMCLVRTRLTPVGPVERLIFLPAMSLSTWRAITLSILSRRPATLGLRSKQRKCHDPERHHLRVQLRRSVRQKLQWDCSELEIYQWCCQRVAPVDDGDHRQEQSAKRSGAPAFQARAFLLREAAAIPSMGTLSLGSASAFSGKAATTSSRTCSARPSRLHSPIIAAIGTTSGYG
jgi:hypothetical protein